MKVKNNVQVNGRFKKELPVDENFLQLIVEIVVYDRVLPILIIIQSSRWENFKRAFPNRFNFVSISGTLENDGNNYIVFANSVSCFDNSLGDSLNETMTQFSGIVELKRKFDFNTSSKLYLKRLVFETVGERHTRLEAIALRNVAPYFDNLKEGDYMILKANYVKDKKEGYPPYWRISQSPQLLDQKEAFAS